MKILYGVQGTGNGHVTRARAMQKALNEAGISVDWVFSGRTRESYFDMEMFGDFRCFKGLSFSINAGQIDPIKTVTEASFKVLLKDVSTLDLSGYDLIISDFEPVVAWAAKVKKVPCIGIGHQYAFFHDIPKVKNARASYAIMKWFAPVDFAIGLHWHHFGQKILPPIIEQHLTPEFSADKKALVYLPFEDTHKIIGTLNSLPFEFILHSKDYLPGNYKNVQVKGFSVTGFQESLTLCDSVICNAGFELASECLSLGKKLLVKPLKGQIEQTSNALAIDQLQYGYVTEEIDAKSVCFFLTTAKSTTIHYPDIAQLIAQWILHYPVKPFSELVAKAWSSVAIKSDIVDHSYKPPIRVA
jgi:uncharacterized protein (TIGR00661 family)